ncbi:MAG: hypothetical protein ABL895_04825 [Cyclobacteriaceae bacterium]
MIQIACWCNQHASARTQHQQGQLDMIEGEFSEMQKRKTITYKLSYMKIYPKESSQEVVFGTK